MLNTQRISLDTVIQQNHGFIASDMDGEKVMMSIQQGKYYNLGMVGGAIWNHIHTPILVSELIASLMKEYVVEYQECEQQVLGFLELLYKEGLIDARDK